MFTFPSFIYDEMRAVQPRIAQQWFPRVSRKSKEKSAATFQESDPKQSESWLVRNFRNQGKLNTSRYNLCKIIEQIGPKMFRVQEAMSKRIYNVHRKSLKMTASPKVHKERELRKEKQRKSYKKAKKVKKAIDKTVGATKTTVEKPARDLAAAVRIRSKSTTRVVALMMEESQRCSSSRPTNQKRM